MAVTVYNITLFFHVLSVVLWLWTIPVFMVIDRILPHMKEENVPKAIKVTSLNERFSIAAIIGIFLTGSLMTELGDWGWLPFISHTWLAIKQTIFMILVIGGGLTLSRMDRGIQRAIEESESLDIIHKKYRRLMMGTHTLSLLIIINIFLGTNKPF